MPTLFVYGTLKRGDCRHAALSGQKFLGDATTTDSYRMFDLGNYPGLIADETGTHISGELYEVDTDCLGRLDKIEGVAEGLYRRESICLQSSLHDQSVETYFYQQSIVGFPEITNWSVDSSTEHARPQRGSNG